MIRTIKGLFLLSLFGVLSCKPKPQVPDPAVPVNLIKVPAIKVTYYDKFPATTAALLQVDLRPEIQGYVTAILVKDGAHVKKGEELYEIDKRLFQQAYDQATANLRVAEANQVQAKQDADRYTYLNQYDAVAKQVLDHAVIALQSANEQIKAAEHAAEIAKTNLSYSVVYAPFNGTVGFSQVRVGYMVSVGSTILNTISSDDPMGVDFYITEKQLPHYDDIYSGKIKAPDSLFTILMPNGSLYPYTGKISVIDRSVDPQAGTVHIRLVFPNPDLTLRVGMSCVVRVRNQDTAPQLVIPYKSVVEQMGEYFVYTVVDTLIVRADTTHKEREQNLADTANSAPRPHAFQRKVQLGQVIGANVIIKAGINEGDEVVVDGVQALHDGSLVTTANKQGPKTENSAGNNENKPGVNGTESAAKTGNDKKNM